MDHDPTCKIKNSHLCKQAASPHHMDKRIVNKELPDDQENNVSLKRNSVCKCSSNQSWGNDCKHHLIGYEDKFWDFPVSIHSIWSNSCLLYTSPSPRDRTRSRMPSS